MVYGWQPLGFQEGANVVKPDWARPGAAQFVRFTPKSGHSPRNIKVSFGPAPTPRATTSIPPLDRAAHRGHLLRRAVASLCCLLHGLEKVATGTRHLLYARSIKPSAILQFVLRVEAEEIRRTLRIIGSRHILCLIDNVGEGEAVLRGERLHVVKRVLAINPGIVRHNGDGADTDFI